MFVNRFQLSTVAADSTGGMEIVLKDREIRTLLGDATDAVDIDVLTTTLLP